MIGKWDLGHYALSLWPAKRGFDQSLFLTCYGYKDYTEHLNLGDFYDLHDGTTNLHLNSTPAWSYSSSSSSSSNDDADDFGYAYGEGFSDDDINANDVYGVGGGGNIGERGKRRMRSRRRKYKKRRGKRGRIRRSLKSTEDEEEEEAEAEEEAKVEFESYTSSSSSSSSWKQGSSYSTLVFARRAIAAVEDYATSVKLAATAAAAAAATATATAAATEREVQNMRREEPSSASSSHATSSFSSSFSSSSSSSSSSYEHPGLFMFLAWNAVHTTLSLPDGYGDTDEYAEVVAAANEGGKLSTGNPDRLTLAGALKVSVYYFRRTHLHSFICSFFCSCSCLYVFFIMHSSFIIFFDFDLSLIFQLNVSLAALLNER
jgi:hypothetical protein